MIERVPEKMHVATLPGRLGADFANRLYQPRVVVADDKLHAVQPTRPQPLEKRAPTRGTFAVGELHTQHAPPPFVIDADGDQDRAAANHAGLTDALPAHLRGTGFGAFNLVAVVAGQAAAPFVVAGISSLYGENLRIALLVVSPLSYLGAAVLWRARKFLDDDMQKIMVAVLTAIQDEHDRIAAQAPPQADAEPELAN